MLLDFLRKGEKAIEAANIGRSNLAKGQYAEAIANFTRAIKLSPLDPAYYTDRAIARSEIGDDERASADFEIALAILREENRCQAQFLAVLDKYTQSMR